MNKSGFVKKRDRDKGEELWLIEFCKGKGLLFGCLS